MQDVFFLNSWCMRNRLFQMDFNRRAPSGTLSELMGKAALNGDVQARTSGCAGPPNTPGRPGLPTRGARDWRRDEDDPHPRMTQ